MMMEYGPKGLFYPVNTKYDKMPTLAKWRKQYPEYDKMMKAPDGNAYAFAYLTPFNNFGDCLMVTHQMPELGIDPDKDLDTWDDVEAMMKKAKAMWPENFPFVTRRGSVGSSELGVYFGTSSDGNRWYVNPQSGEFNYGPVEPNFKRMVEYLAKWYKEELMHPDWFTTKEEIWRELTGNQKAVITVDHFSQAFSMGGKDADENPRTWRPIVAPKLDGKRYYTTAGRPNVDTSQLGAIWNKSKYVDRIIQYIDWAYTDEAAEMQIFGAEGYSAARDSNGDLYFSIGTENVQWVDHVFTDDAGKKYSLFDLGLLGYTNWFRTWEGFYYYTSANLMVAAGTAGAIVEWSKNQLTWFNNVPNGIAPSQPKFAIASDMQDRIQDLKVQIETATDEAIVQFVRGTRNLSEWDAYVKQLKDMGLDEALDIYRAAYKDYLAR